MSRMREPFTESITIGCPPTDLKALTGEFTPPGISSCQRINTIQKLENAKRVKPREIRRTCGERFQQNEFAISTSATFQIQHCPHARRYVLQTVLDDWYINRIKYIFDSIDSEAHGYENLGTTVF